MLIALIMRMSESTLLGIVWCFVTSALNTPDRNIHVNPTPNRPTQARRLRQKRIVLTNDENKDLNDKTPLCLEYSRMRSHLLCVNRIQQWLLFRIAPCPGIALNKSKSWVVVRHKHILNFEKFKSHLGLVAWFALMCQYVLFEFEKPRTKTTIKNGPFHLFWAMLVCVCIGISFGCVQLVGLTLKTGFVTVTQASN